MLARRLREGLLVLAVGASGCAALVDQVVWFRMLHRAFGGTAPAATTVLAVFMAGLGAGALWAGERAGQIGRARCLRAYVAIEIAIGVLVCTTPFVLGTLPELYALYARAFGWSPLARTLAQSSGTALALFPPTALMGATLPLLLGALDPREDGVARAVGKLYAGNNTGAVIGAMGAGFVLIAALGETRTLWTAALLNLVAAGCATLFGRAAGKRTAAANDALDPPAAAPAASSNAPWLLLLGAGTSGFVVLAYEVLWTRLLVPLLGSTVYAFACMLAVVLLGLALGSALAARFGDRAREQQSLFGLLVALTGALALFTLQSAERLVVPTLQLLELHPSFGWRFVAVPVLITGVVALPATMLSGAAMPIGIRCLAQRRRAPGSAGVMYAANTLGAIGGAGLIGLVLIPELGIGRSASATALVAAVVGAMLVIGGGRARRRWLTGGLPLATVAVLGIVQPALSLELFAGGLHMLSAAQRKLVIRHGLEVQRFNSEVLYVGEGQQTTLLVERRFGRRAFFVDGKPEASDGKMDMRNQYLLGHLPALLHGAPRRSLVVGLGTGMTAGCLTLYGDVDVAELNELMPEVARRFADLNHGVANHPRVSIAIEDGRAFLRTRERQYDVITVDPIHPYVAGASALYTRDYFASVKRRLAPGGVVSHWLPLYQLGWQDVTGVLRSFADVFPDATVYSTGQDAVLIGNAGPELPSAERFRAGFERPGVRADLARVWLDSPERLAATASLGAAALARLVRDARLITDDDTWIEFTAPCWFQAPTLANVARIAAQRAAPRPDSSEAARRAAATYTAILEATVRGATPAARNLLELASARDPESRELRGRLRMFEGIAPTDPGL